MRTSVKSWPLEIDPTPNILDASCKTYPGASVLDVLVQEEEEEEERNKESRDSNLDGAAGAVHLMPNDNCFIWLNAMVAETNSFLSCWMYIFGPEKV